MGDSDSAATELAAAKGAEEKKQEAELCSTEAQQKAKASRAKAERIGASR